MDTIEGRAMGARPAHRVVLYAKSDVWWVQPFSANPFTPVDSKAHWKSATHFGTEYAALLVDRGFSPPANIAELPPQGGPVIAVGRVKGRGYKDPESLKGLRFSGFDWDVRYQPSDRGGGMNDYDPANAWLDDRGRLHLRITKGPKGWRCSEIRMKDPLGYGTYSFTIADVGHLEPAAVLGIYTYDPTAQRQNYREMNIEFSRWGDALNKTAQFAIQPYYISANVVRFNVPPGKLKHSLHWAPGRADFRTVHAAGGGPSVADYSFTSGVPSPGEESIYIALYAYGRARAPLRRETEVVVERFDYIP
ncbi:MAG TPA: hypothetical protein VER03_16790 [Bryobacteraceae bacterium]|nr:hypothetical protein [Bryobacteraceae bacterium]